MNFFNRKKLCLSSFFFILFCVKIVAQYGTPAVAGARGAAMGNTGVNSQDVWATMRNQAGLAQLESTSVGVQGETRFVAVGIQTVGLAAAVPTKSGTFGLALNYFGNATYNDQKVGISYARKLFAGVAIGAQFDYVGLRIAEYGSKSLFTFELGLQSDLPKGFRVAAHIFSPIRIAVTPNEYLPTTFTLGANYSPNKRVSVVLEVEKDIQHQANLKFGVEYFVVPMLALRVGATTFPFTNSLGILINYIITPTT